MIRTLLLLAAPVVCWCADLVLPSNAVERSGTMPVVYRTNGLATGKGTLSVRWSDVHGRVIEDRTIPVTLNDENEIGFSLDLRRAVGMRNEIIARLEFQGMNKKNQEDKRNETAKVEFIASPAARDWWDYEIIMWQPRSKEQFGALKNIGIRGGQWVGRNRNIPEFLLSNDLRWYAENIATDFYSEYHRYFPDRRNEWKFAAAREEYKKDRTNKEALKRRPSLSDPAWVTKVHDRLVESTKFYAPYRPFFYSLGDEAGIANLAAFWDFDFSDESLVPMRRWLKERYGTLEALNTQWDTKFGYWDAVIPPTTDEAMKKPGENFSAWSDFKEWMDVSFERALRMGREAVQSVDPRAFVGIGGGQMPGWGGYDYSRIAKALNAIEPYDIGNNIEILRSLNPRMAVLTTSFARGPWERHRVWYELLHGNRGLIIWDDKSAFVGPGAAIGERGTEVEAYYREIRGGLGALLLNSERTSDPIAIHYSQPSMRIEWMLAQRPKGENWVNRNSSTEYRDSEFLRLRESLCRAVEDQGLQYNFVSYGQVEEGELTRRGYRILLLPRSTALSAAEASAMREFVAQGGTLIADGQPGAFDEHSRRLAKPQLEDVFAAGSYGRGKAVLLKTGMLNYHQDRVVEKEGAASRMLGELLRGAGVKPEFAVTDASGNAVTGVETHTFRNGGMHIVALHRNPELRIDELGPPEFKSNDRFAKPANVKLKLPGERFVYDVRAGKALGRRSVMDVTVEPYEPSVFAISALEIPALEVSAPAEAKQGSTVELGIRFAGTTLAATHVVHVDVLNPAGQVVPYYSGNLRVPLGRANYAIPLAVSDAAGRWQARVKDQMTGQVKMITVEVKAQKELAVNGR